MAPDALWFSRGSAVGLEVCDGSSEAAPRQDARGRAARSSRPAARLLPGRSPSRSISSITGSCRTISSSAAASPTGCISRTKAASSTSSPRPSPEGGRDREPRGGRYLRDRDRPAAGRKEGPAVHRAAARLLQADLQRPRLGRHGRRDHGRVADPREGVWTRSLLAASPMPAAGAVLYVGRFIDVKSCLVIPAPPPARLLASLAVRAFER